jgi:probable rRNA maturation factor
MNNPSISLFSEQCDFKYSKKENLFKWIKLCFGAEGTPLSGLNIIFCNDEYLLKINRKYLKHDFYTDIITFDHSDKPDSIAADLYISIDRVRENAQNLDIDFYDELDRVIIHGLLHLMGYSDKTPADQKIMREKEDACLLLRPI